MSRYGPNPITQQYMGHTQKGPRRVVDGLPHVCADGHNHSTEAEVIQCIEAHKVYVCSSNHMHTEKSDAESEEEQFRDKELVRKHEREMMDKQIKMADNLRAMGWNFRQHGMPSLSWKDS